LQGFQIKNFHLFVLVSNWQIKRFSPNISSALCMEGLRKSVAYVEPDNDFELRVYRLVAGEALAGLVFKHAFPRSVVIELSASRVTGGTEAHGFTALSSGSA